jgi:putative hydroxymethylpyrimidine transport system permease protein
MAPTESHRLQRAAGRALPPFVLLVGAVVVWEVVVRLDHVPSYLVPSPAAVASSLHGDAHLLGGATLVTVREMIAGYLLAVAGALAIAVFLHFSSALRKALLPLLVLSQAVPTVLLAPILVGYGIEPKLAVVAVVCFFPIVVNAVDGFRAADPQLLLLMRALHAGRISTFRRLEFPAALPAIFSGARVAATYAAVGAVFGEWAGSSAGLGFVILQAQPALDTARILAAVLILSAVALGLYALVTLAQRLLIPWYTEASRE